MMPIKFCPFCGSDDVRYYDEEVPQYAFCRGCDRWISAVDDWTLRDIEYIVSKVRMIKKRAEQIKKVTE